MENWIFFLATSAFKLLLPLRKINSFFFACPSSTNSGSTVLRKEPGNLKEIKKEKLKRLSLIRLYKK